MTYFEVSLRAYHPARTAFMRALASGQSFDAALAVREEMWNAEMKSYCVRCKDWKHITAFNRKTPTCPQSICISCYADYRRGRALLNK